MIIPVLVQRLGQQEVIEPSEELRLEMTQLLSKLVRLCENKMYLYLDDVIRILQRGILDPYPEMKKESCRCAALMAQATKGHFHMQSENLIKPLAMTIAHQHSRVRVEVVKAIGMSCLVYSCVFVKFTLCYSCKGKLYLALATGILKSCLLAINLLYVLLIPRHFWSRL